MTDTAALLDEARNLLVMNRPAEAREVLTRAVKDAPDDCDAVQMLAIACFAAGDVEQALPLFRKSLESAPDRGHFWANYVSALSQIPSRTGDMVAAANEALQRFPKQAEISLTLSDHYARVGDFSRCKNVLENAVRALPQHGELRIRLIQSYRQSGEFDKAMAMLSPLLWSEPRHVEVIRLHGSILNDQGHLRQAGECWEKILAIAPEDEDVLLKLVVGRRKCCDWRDFDTLATRIHQKSEANLAAGKLPVETVLLTLSTSMDSEYQYRVAKAWAENRGQGRLQRFSHSSAPRPADGSARITLGYISDEFRDHPIGLLMRDYFKHHDRNRFRAIAYFDQPIDESDPVFQSIKASCEESRVIAGMNDELLADLIHRDGVDILLDLKGWRQGNRLATFAMRPAPIGVAFQGFPGTTGANYVDYIVVDDCIVPENESGTYAEKLTYLGRCYQVNSESTTPFDELRARAGTRRDHDLPENAIVLASFNQAYKLDPHMMTVWLDIMRTAENSVLWLLELNEACRTNLQKFAAEHAVDPKRLVFASWADNAAHLARLTHADLGLDTRVYTGHATTSDSLWCQVPVVTLPGTHFASRVSASILREVGLNELVVSSLTAYRDLVLELIANAPRRESLRSRLTTDHLRATLFNTKNYVRRVEDLFQQMVDVHREGQPPRMLRCRI